MLKVAVLQLKVKSDVPGLNVGETVPLKTTEAAEKGLFKVTVDDPKFIVVGLLLWQIKLITVILKLFVLKVPWFIVNVVTKSWSDKEQDPLASFIVK